MTATMHWFDPEGGFWALCGDDGVTYDPLSLPAEYPLVDIAAISALP